MKRVRVTLVVSALCFLLLAPAWGAEKAIRILYVNDFHGFAEPHRPLGSEVKAGGIAYLAGKVNLLRRERPSLLLAAGDMIQGDNWANLFHGKSSIEVMNKMGFNAMVVGNHEFDFGQEVLRRRISEASFPVLGANVEGFDVLKPYVIKDVGGVRVAVIGVVTEDTPVSTDPRNVVGLRFEPPADAVRRYIGELKGKADIFVVLSHIGYAADRTLAEDVKGIDVIVGGHSHTKLESPVKVGETIIVQAWEHAKALGVLELMVKDGRISGYEGHLEEIKPVPGSEDEAVMAIVDKYRERVDKVLDQPIGTAEVDLDGENVRAGETNLGDLIADIMRKTSGADATIINGGSIRTSINKGQIRAKDVYSALPFNNYIVAVRLIGAQIRQALEHGVSEVERGEGRFPQVSGLTFTYSRQAPAGSRVRQVLIGGRPLEEDREYCVATNDFLAAGGDGYKAFGDAVRSSKDFAIVGGMMKGERLVYSDAGTWLRDVVIEYIKGHKVIAPVVEGRIKDVE
jgi:2',3'-cyclic-nucleotide 2'-phosphodiesterase (5'-nucleotidase family)